MEEFFFLLLGLGFFVYIIILVERSEERMYQRRLNEAREFGYRDSKIQKEAQDPKKK